MAEYERAIHDVFGEDSDGELVPWDDTQIMEGGDADQIQDRHNVEILDNGDVKKTREEMIEHGPRSGMEFASRESLFQAYQDFAKVQGFCVSSRNFQGVKSIL